MTQNQKVPIALDVEIAPHLRLREVACQCRNCEGKVAPMNVRLLVAWMHWRERRGFPIHVESAYRCPRHNRAVGGARNSRHLFGRALDIHQVNGSDGVIDFLDDDLLVELLACGFNGIGRSKNRLHIDVRQQAYFWRYLANGKHERDAEAFEMFRQRGA